MSSKQEKTPEEKKKKIALTYAGTITFLIFVIWIVFFVGDAKRELDRTADNRVALFSIFEDNIGKFADKFVDHFKNIPSTLIATSSDEVLISTSTASTTSSTTTEDISTTTEINNQ
ncbi:MAG: hypothetical protein WCO18_01330 [bacterium]